MKALQRQAEERVYGGNRSFLVSLEKEDDTGVYPGLYRYILTVSENENTVASFVTNTFEYSPGCPLDAESVARRKMEEWAIEIRENPQGFIMDHQVPPKTSTGYPHAEVLVIQGSPRADGNCSILAGWAVEYSSEKECSTLVIYPHDMLLNPCIGCYQCYNTGSCTQSDDMEGIIHAIMNARVIIVCAPVYTETVPGALKILVDRCLALHAYRTLHGGRRDQKGLIFAVAGRTGLSNFRCLTRVVRAFFLNTGIVPAGEICIDRMDEQKDIRAMKEIREQVQALIHDTV